MVAIVRTSASTSSPDRTRNSVARAHGLALDAGGGVDRQAVVALGALEDAVEQDKVLVDRPGGQAALVDVMGAEGIDHLRGQLGQRQLAERRHEDVVDDVAVVAQRGLAALAVELKAVGRASR